MRAKDNMRSGGEVLVDQLIVNGVQHVFCVPGESYLAALDAFHDRPVTVTVCRQEGGAAMMAEAVGKLTGRPGICFVTRGPGATNASPGLHIARDPTYLNWRYRSSPRSYVRVGDAIITHAHWQGLSCAVVCETADTGSLRRATAAADADVAVALVNPGEERTYLSAGFVPSPRTIRFIGKRLSDESPALPRQRRAWRLYLGDVDFF